MFLKNYPRQSRVKEALFFLLFLILMIPISPIVLIWLAGEQAEKIAEWYSSIGKRRLSTVWSRIQDPVT
ncbi:DUF4014 family protein [Escherichia coli]|uniref:DUF4014 family protein n=1 Tax=Escherichia coli TaxID=562 RepID=UPI00207CE02A|nr:DUF4014 family protein [Escherichia coli]